MRTAASTPLTLSAFEAALNTRFRVQLDPTATIELLLAEARASRPGTDAEGARHFTLLFRGPRDPLLPQRIYRFDHDTLGTFELFIVPVARGEERCEYEAVFNLAPH